MAIIMARTSFKDKALQWLEEIKAEKNSITNGFTSLQVENKNAFDSQALIQLKMNIATKSGAWIAVLGIS